jgi:hypothetical protein
MPGMKRHSCSMSEPEAPPIIQMKELKPREGQKPVQSHTAMSPVNGLGHFPILEPLSLPLTLPSFITFWFCGANGRASLWYPSIHKGCLEPALFPLKRNQAKLSHKN